MCIKQKASPFDGALRFDLLLALTAADRASNAVLATARGPLDAYRVIPPKARCSSRHARPGIAAEALEARFVRVGEVPFSSERKLMSTIHTDAERREMLHRVHEGRAGHIAGELCA